MTRLPLGPVTPAQAGVHALNTQPSDFDGTLAFSPPVYGNWVSWSSRNGLFSGQTVARWVTATGREETQFLNLFGEYLGRPSMLARDRILEPMTLERCDAFQNCDGA